VLRLRDRGDRAVRFPSLQLRRFGVAFAAAGLLVAVAGCGGGSGDELNRQNVYGKVTLDGKPLPNGIISFDPEGGAATAAAAGGVITDGAYNIDRASGPTPGKYRVSIRSAGEGSGIDPTAAPGAPPKPKKHAADPIPPEYNTKSTLTAEVKDTATEVNFDLKSK